jgi:hypothetical protein
MDKTCCTCIAPAASLGAILAPSAWAAGVTLADLEDALIETSVVYDRTGRWGDQVGSGRPRDDRKFAQAENVTPPSFGT